VSAGLVVLEGRRYGLVSSHFAELRRMCAHEFSSSLCHAAAAHVVCCDASVSSKADCDGAAMMLILCPAGMS
jgi:hypothetical protein